jgi:hypothetical protein
MTFSPFEDFRPPQPSAIAATAERYGTFVGKRALVEI